MAETWRALITAKAFSITGTAANMAGLLNAGTNIIKIRRLGFVNIQTSGVTGVMCKGTISRYTGASWAAPTTVTPVPYDSTNAALDSVTCGHTGTAAGSETIISSYVWSSDEPAAAGATVDELETFNHLGIQIDYGYGDDAVQSIALRQDQMILVKNTVGAAGLVDIWIEFTSESP